MKRLIIEISYETMGDRNVALRRLLNEHIHSGEFRFTSHRYCMTGVLSDDSIQLINGQICHVIRSRMDEC